MARKLDSFPEPLKRGHAGKYPWDTWLNGDVWELTHGEDFDTSMETFRGYVFSIAQNRGHGAKTSVRGSKIIVQAVSRPGRNLVAITDKKVS